MSNNFEDTTQALKNLIDEDKQRIQTIQTKKLKELYFLSKFGNLADYETGYNFIPKVDEIIQYFKDFSIINEELLTFNETLNISENQKKIKKLPNIIQPSEIYQKEIERETEILTKIEELKSKGYFESIHQIQKTHDFKLNKCFQDYFLEEMKWLATDFAQEHRWKKHAARKLAKDISKHYSKIVSVEIKKYKDELTVNKKTCLYISKLIKSFWDETYHRLNTVKNKIEEKKRLKLLNDGLNTLVGESEKMTAQLVENLKEEPSEESTNSSSDQESDVISNSEYDPSDIEDELKYLNDQKDMSIEEIVNNLPAQYACEYKRKLACENIGGSIHKGFESLKSSEIDETLDSCTNRFSVLSDSVVQYQPKNILEISEENKIGAPKLLRKMLRSYQLVGLNWLMSLHDKNLNGILADEMGLGKTIQTIALLAHLAEVCNIWGPHLIIVPSSVLINWDNEFKKWCPSFKIITYYGNKKERKNKRKNWSNIYSFFACITSYKIVIQDYQIFKRKAWYYMILDEAQNIKNFKTQRWQMLVSLNTQRRLLLTGTPLQNDLTELWSLLNFVMPDHFEDSSLFKEVFAKSINNIIDNNSSKSNEFINKLHRVLRPFMLRRLKQQVELQMPKKYERVVQCQLSKRQRILYDEFMSLDNTKNLLQSQNVISILQIIMKLRKVCNHPDLFEPRSVESPYRPDTFSYFIPSIFLLRQDFHSLNYDKTHDIRANFPSLIFTSTQLDSFFNPILSQVAFPSKNEIVDKNQYLLNLLLNSTSQKLKLFDSKNNSAPISIIDGKSCKICFCSYGCNCSALVDPTPSALFLYSCCLSSKFYKPELREILQNRFMTNILRTAASQEFSFNSNFSFISSNLLNGIAEESPDRNIDLFPSLKQIFARYIFLLKTFIFYVPRAMTSKYSIVPNYPCPFDETKYIPEAKVLWQKCKLFWPYYINRSMLFPERRMIQYDCGKLQELDALLKYLKRSNHRVLIFTQMTKMLDILEKFLAYHTYKYLRLDGSTKIEHRHIISERFNNDNSIFCLILSTRTGGIGMNLIGADVVVFYDSDWNPSSDAQAQDRCHRIGQTKDVYIYRLISEKTIEENILDRANKKRFLNQIAVENAHLDDQTLKFSTIHSLFEENSKIFTNKEKIIIGENDADAVADVTTNNIDAILHKAEKDEDSDASETKATKGKVKGIGEKVEKVEKDSSQNSKHSYNSLFASHKIKPIDLFAMRQTIVMSENNMEDFFQDLDDNSLLKSWKECESLKTVLHNYDEEIDILPKDDNLFYDNLNPYPPEKTSIWSSLGESIWSFYSPSLKDTSTQYTDLSSNFDLLGIDTLPEYENINYSFNGDLKPNHGQYSVPQIGLVQTADAEIKPEVNNNIPNTAEPLKSIIDFATTGSGVSKEDVNWELVSHVYNSSQSLNQSTPTSIKREIPTLLKNIDDETEVSKSPKTKAAYNLDLLDKADIDKKSSHMFFTKPHTKHNCIKDKIMLDKLKFPDIVELRAITLDAAVPLPEKVHSVCEEIRKNAGKEEKGRITDLDKLIPIFNTSNIHPQQGSYSTPISLNPQLSYSALSTTLTPLSKIATSTQNIGHQPIGARAATNLNIYSNPRPLTRLVQHNARNQFDHIRQTVQPLLSDSGLTRYSSSNLRLSMHPNTSNSTASTNPILNASTGTMTPSGILRPNQINLSTNSQNKAPTTGGPRHQQVYLQLQRQTTPQLQVSQQLRPSMNMSVGNQHPNSQAPLLAVQSNVQQGNRLATANSTNSQIQFLQRQHARQLVNSQRLLPPTSQTQNSSNSYGNFVISNTIQPNTPVPQTSASTVPNLQSNELSQITIRAAKRPNEVTPPISQPPPKLPTTQNSTTILYPRNP